MPTTRRDELGALLKTTLGSDNVYFQPPASKSMRYPCIRYKLAESGPVAPFANAFANDARYSDRDLYSVTVIDADPDSLIPSRMRQLEYCRLVKRYQADNLNHFVFSLYW